MTLIETPLTRPLADILAQPAGPDLRLIWLGQAGFVIDGGGRRIVIDPYLSDSLAEKYRGKTFDHQRMMPVPIAPDMIGHVDLVLATHAHTDHLDPGTLPALMAANPAARLVAPRAAAATALQRAGIAPDRLVAIETGDRLTCDGVPITATRAAHERIERDGNGDHLYLGLAITLVGMTVFHSGDTIPFDGQAEEVRALGADLALLPVNGRDALRAANGVPGNMTMAEAMALARDTGIGAMIAHHFDMFAFNTVPRSDVVAAATTANGPVVFAARRDVSYGARSEITGQSR